MKYNVITNSNRWIYGIAIFTLIFLGVSILFELLDIQTLPTQVSGVLFEVVVTAIITVLLLNGQSATEEERDKSLRVFEKKQEVYHHFLENFKQIIRDGKVAISVGEDDKNIDELKELLFELGYIQLHTSEQNTKMIFSEVAEIIKLLNHFETEGSRQQQQLPIFYANLSKHLFQIISILKADLYGKDTTTIDSELVKELLECCDLFVENSELNQYELQNYFWSSLQEKLKNRGYKFKPHDFQHDISQFYARARNRHRWYGINIPLYTSKEGEIFNFRLEIENTLFYGVVRNEKGQPNDELVNICSSLGFRPSEHWFGWKFFDRNSLNFWSMESEAFQRLNHPMKREMLMEEIAQEIDNYIKQLKTVIEAKQL